MTLDELMERLAEVFSQAADTLETIANEIEELKKRAEALEWEREAWKASEPLRLLRRHLPFQGRLPAISVAVAMREHTAVTGK